MNMNRTLTFLRTSLLCTLLALSAPHAPAQASSPSRFRGDPVTLNFVNAEIEGVSRAMGAILRRQFVVDPRVKGTITLYSETPMTPREAYLNFLAALRGAGFTVVESGGLFKVVPEADAKVQSSTVTVGNTTRQRGDQVLTQIYKLNHENANNLVAVLRPLISPNNTINANPGNNSLVITDYADNLTRIAKIISAMDTPAAGDIEVIPLKHAVAADVAAFVQRLADPSSAGGIGQIPGFPGGSSVGSNSILVDPRSNALIVRAANASRLATIRALVDKLDVPVAGNNGMGNIWVVYLKNADAVKLATILRAAYPSSQAANNAGGGGGGLPNTVTPNTPQPNQGGGGQQNGASPQATAPITASAGPSTGGFVQADPSTNSLIITAPEPMYRQLRAMIDQLDSRRAQVYVESMIVKVDDEKAAEFGFQWQNFFGDKGDKNIVGLGTNFGAGSNNIVQLGAALGGNGGERAGAAEVLKGGIPAGLNVGVLRKISDFYTLGALARFLQTNVGANVLSTPTLMTLDNEEAKIVIGQNVPFVTGSFTNTGTGGGAANPFQTIERKDVGLTLRIKPQIGENGTVRMTIFQENSSVLNTTANGPTTDKSSIETNIVVDDGQTMVLGGLLKDEYTDNQGRVPGLASIPLVGGLFKSESRKRIKSNLMVFLRPVVVRSQDDATKLSLDRYDMIRAQQKDAQPAKSWVLPINEAPVIPPQRAPQGASAASSPSLLLPQKPLSAASAPSTIVLTVPQTATATASSPRSAAQDASGAATTRPVDTSTLPR
jgi:general secretion pathway protein D